MERIIINPNIYLDPMEIDIISKEIKAKANRLELSIEANKATEELVNKPGAYKDITDALKADLVTCKSVIEKISRILE